MLLVSRHGEPLDRLARRIDLAVIPSRKLIDDIVATACTRLHALAAAGKIQPFRTWCNAGAWSDAALALIRHELPDWSIRRLVCDDGLWFCALSRWPNLPAELDEVVEASHTDMSLAMLLALVEAKRASAEAAQASTHAGIARTECHRLCCDSFS